VTPTIGGRLQTRLVMLSSVGLAWTLAVTPLLPRPGWASLALAYRVTMSTSIAMTIIGIAWEFVYHGLQQLRWDKDWPSGLALLTGVTEAVPVWLVLHALRLVPGDLGLSSPLLPLYAAQFGSAWLVVWLVLHGPIRVLAPRWRFEGGVFSRRPHDSVLTFIVSNTGLIFALATLWLAWR
jgi:hypothetical protein